MNANWEEKLALKTKLIAEAKLAKLAKRDKRDKVIAECRKLVKDWKKRSLSLRVCAYELAAILPKEDK